MSEKPEDAIYAATYLRHIRDQPHQALGLLHRQATMLLVDALAIQVKSKAGNPVQNIGEIAALCHELLTSDAPKDVTTQSARLISRLVVYDIDLWDPDQPWDQIIEYLQVARTHKPELLDVRRALVLSLSFRYILTCVNDDYEEVVSVLDEIITSGVPGDSQGEFVQGVMALLALIRSNAYHTPEYSEEAMYHARGFLAASSSPKEGPLISSNLEHAAKQRFHYFGPIEGLGASSGNSALSQPVSVGYEDDDSEFGRRNMTRKLLEGLLTRICNNDITDIDEAIEKGRTKLASLDPRDVHTSSVFRSFDNVLLKHSSAQTGSSTLTSRLPHAVRFLTVRQHSGSAPGHLFSFHGLCSPATCPFRVTVCKTWMKGWNYSPSGLTTNIRACPSDAGLHASGYLLRDVPDTHPSPQRTRALCH